MWSDEKLLGFAGSVKYSGNAVDVIISNKFLQAVTLLILTIFQAILTLQLVRSVGDKAVTKGKTVDKPEDPVKEGYVFEGWYPVKDGIMAISSLTRMSRALSTRPTQR